MKLNKKTIIVASIIGVLAIGGGTGMVIHNNQVYAQQAAEKKKESKAAYEQLKKDAKSAIDKAFETRKDEDITKTQEAIHKLKEKDQKEFKLELATLKAFLSQIKETTKLIDTAEKSKKDDDVKAAQTAIDGEKDKYLEKDKKSHQERLDKIKKAISDQKAKADQEKRAAEEKAKAESTAKEAAQAQQEQSATQSKVNAGTEAPVTGNGYTDTEGTNNPGTDQGYYPTNQEPQNQAPAAQTPTQPAPSGGGGGATDVPPGGMTQDQLDQSANEQTDPTKDPNSPWFNK